jgi:hypothetical protein
MDDNLDLHSQDCNFNIVVHLVTISLALLACHADVNLVLQSPNGYLDMVIEIQDTITGSAGNELVAD